MENLKGIGKKSRDYLVQVLQGTSGIITSENVRSILDITSSQAGKYLHRWTVAGWVQRLKRGVYFPIPIDASTSDISVENPWIVAHTLFKPCYIGGWSAAEYWDFTEQVYSSIFVMTIKHHNYQKTKIGGIEFYIKQIKPEYIFGTKTVWQDKNKIQVSDPTRTIIDMFNKPDIGGGIRPTVDIFQQYIDSEHCNLKLAIEYAEKLENKTIFKRLGFILETYHSSNKAVIKECQKRISEGYSKFDPSLNNDRIITRWKLRIPSNWIDIINDR